MKHQTLEQVPAMYSPAQVRFLAFCSAYAGQVVRHGAVKEWRHQKKHFPDLWEKLTPHTTLIKSGSPVPCSVPQWELLDKHLPRATAAWPIYFYLADIYQREGENFLVSRRDIQEVLGTSNIATANAIKSLNGSLISGYFPNGQAMMIVMVNIGDEYTWRQRYNLRRRTKTYIQSPEGKVFSIAYGEQKSFSQRHGISETSVSRIIRGENILGWKKIMPHSLYEHL